MPTDFSSPDRYHRQMLLPGIGETGQARLAQSHALVVGCGALGCPIIDALVRAGVGTLTIVDRDIIELTNLQRQMLYDEADVEAGTPKAIAAKARAERINRNVTVHAHVDDFTPRNAERLADGAEIILDGLDNFETRYLLNDLAVKLHIPYIYGGAVGTTGMSFTILPAGDAPQEQQITWIDEQATPCLRCLFPDAPPPGSTPTCDTAGVLGPVVTTIAAHQAAQAIKLLTANVDALDRAMLSLDMWTNELRRFDVSNARDGSNCPCCVQRDFTHLTGDAQAQTTSLCGRGAVQISPPGQVADAADGANGGIDLARIAQQLQSHGSFTCNAHLLRGELTRERGPNGEPIELTLFANGRAIIKGATEPEHARSIYARYVGA